MKQWASTDTIALADHHCTFCLGFGMRGSYGSTMTVCKCVLRKIFRICLHRFRKCAAAAPRMTCTRLDPQRLERSGEHTSGEFSSAVCGRPERIRYGFPNEEYCADFLSIAKRVLGDGSRLHKIFKWHHIYGADYHLVNRKLGRDSEDRTICHEFYRIEERLGREFAECKPYGLYPLDEYFGVRIRGRRSAA